MKVEVHQQFILVFGLCSRIDNIKPEHLSTLNVFLVSIIRNDNPGFHGKHDG